jgi:hypothetical protein
MILHFAAESFCFDHQYTETTSTRKCLSQTVAFLPVHADYIYDAASG